MFVVMNRIPVNPEYNEAFIERFQDRAALVDRMPGFVSFQLLQPAGPDLPFVVMTIWESQEHFEAWTRSDEFKHGHAQSGRLPQDAFLTHPKLETFDVVINARHGEILAEGAEVGE